ncbi:MAG: hypothetical protein VX988_12520 [Planctomycetota bacterium]|nr:hypothetical protein [Planctomycetota bacterium]
MTNAKKNRVLLHWILASPELTWLFWVLLLSGLAGIERVIGHERSALDNLVDNSILVVGLAGAMLLWVLSFRIPMRNAAEPGMMLLRIALTWLMAPVAGLVAVTVIADDVDGGLLLFHPVWIGCLLAFVVVPLTALWRTYRPSSIR